MKSHLRRQRGDINLNHVIIATAVFATSYTAHIRGCRQEGTSSAIIHGNTTDGKPNIGPPLLHQQQRQSWSWGRKTLSPEQLSVHLLSHSIPSVTLTAGSLFYTHLHILSHISTQHTHTPRTPTPPTSSGPQHLISLTRIQESSPLWHQEWEVSVGESATQSKLLFLNSTKHTQTHSHRRGCSLIHARMHAHTQVTLDLPCLPNTDKP